MRFRPFERLRNRFQERRTQECIPQTQEDLTELQQEVDRMREQKERQREERWEMSHQLNDGWHQYLLKDPGRAITFAYHAEHAQASFVIEPNLLHMPYDENFEIARHTLNGEQYVVISARGPYVGAGIALSAEGLPPQTFHLGDDIPAVQEQEVSEEDVQQRIASLDKFIADPASDPAQVEIAKMLREALTTTGTLKAQQEERIRTLEAELAKIREEGLPPVEQDKKK
ncbi:MAG: hypothetical protein PHI23_03855 [Candidatus Peribacteraceae bacterium]|nr:hypothetical protein [Candidatus Peribacteraceae bacterium]